MDPNSVMTPLTKHSAAEIIQALELLPHPEGGYYRETYRSVEQIQAGALHSRYRGGTRSVSTSIYYMLTDETFSAMHRVASDEVYHFYCGSPLEMLLLYPDGMHKVVLIGPDPMAGQYPQLVIPHGIWQGSRVLAPGKYALVGATVAPGFDFADFEEGTRSELVAQFPTEEKMITALTRR